MSSDLKEKIASLPDVIGIPLAPSIDSIRRQGMSRRHRRITGLALVSALLLLGTGVFIGRVIDSLGATKHGTAVASRGQSTESGASETESSSKTEEPYIFSNISIVSQSDSGSGFEERYRVTIEYDIAWSSSDFPGIHECTWSAYGNDGSVVGRIRDAVPFLRLEPEAKNLQKVILASDPAERATITCAGERLDSPGDTYEEAEPD